MVRVLLASVLVLVFVCDVEARVFRRGRTSSVSASVSFNGGPQSVASAKASYKASRGITGHVGGSFGGARYEGVGFSTASAQAALNNCCYTGQKRVAGSAVVKGARGYFAVKLFW